MRGVSKIWPAMLLVACSGGSTGGAADAGAVLACSGSLRFAGGASGTHTYNHCFIDNNGGTSFGLGQKGSGVTDVAQLTLDPGKAVPKDFTGALPLVSVQVSVVSPTLQAWAAGPGICTLTLTERGLDKSNDPAGRGTLTCNAPLAAVAPNKSSPITLEPADLTVLFHR